MPLKFILFVFAAFLSATNIMGGQKPNIILIYADDLGMGCLGCYGQELIKTPHIDSLAEQGMLFTRVYSSKYCCPARASLMTGTHDSHANSYTQTPGGLVIRKDEQGWDLKTFEEKVKAARKIQPSANETFLPELMKRAGYTTAQFGKLDWGFTTFHGELKRHGWDHYVGYYDHQRAHGFYPRYLWKNGKELPLTGNTRNDAGKTSEVFNAQTTGERRKNRTGKETYSPDVLLAETLDFMSNHKDEPMFILFSTALPHGPVDVPPDYLNKKDYRVLRQAGINAGIDEWEMAATEEYAAMVEMLDDQVGQIVAHLRKLGLDQNTVIIFTSDNGHEIYYRNRALKSLAHTSRNRGGILDGGRRLLDVFRGNRGKTGVRGEMVDFANLKWSNEEGGIRVPMIVWAPGRIAAGKRCDALIANYDHMATFADIAGTSTPAGKDSRSYAHVLFNKQDDAGHDYVIVDRSVITHDGWKLTRSNNKAFLYDLNEDPGENTNLAESHPEQMERLGHIFSKEVGSRRIDRD